MRWHSALQFSRRAGKIEAFRAIFLGLAPVVPHGVKDLQKLPSAEDMFAVDMHLPEETLLLQCCCNYGGTRFREVCSASPHAVLVVHV